MSSCRKLSQPPMSYARKRRNIGRPGAEHPSLEHRLGDRALEPSPRVEHACTRSGQSTAAPGGRAAAGPPDQDGLEPANSELLHPHSRRWNPSAAQGCADEAQTDGTGGGRLCQQHLRGSRALAATVAPHSPRQTPQRRVSPKTPPTLRISMQATRPWSPQLRRRAEPCPAAMPSIAARSGARLRARRSRAGTTRSDHSSEAEPSEQEHPVAEGCPHVSAASAKLPGRGRKGTLTERGG